MVSQPKTKTQRNDQRMRATDSFHLATPQYSPASILALCSIWLLASREPANLPITLQRGLANVELSGAAPVLI